MTTETSRLIIVVDSTSALKAQADLDKLTASAAKAELATAKLAEIGVTSASSMKLAAANTGMAEKRAAELAESEAQATQRIREMVQASLAATEASKARTAAESAATAGSRSTADAVALQGKSWKDIAAAQTAAMQRYTAMRAPVAELQTILAKSTLTSAEVAKAESLLDTAQASGIITAGELSEAFTALDAAKIKDIAVSRAQTAANEAAALSSRAQAELATAASEVLAGNFGRLRRTGAAFANQAGFFDKLMSPTGLGITAVVAGMVAMGAAATKDAENMSTLQRALAATGGALGVTYGQVKALRDGLIDANTSAGDATSLVSQLAMSGKFLGDSLGQAAHAAQAMAELTGSSMASAASAVEQLGQDPVEALKKLNAEYHFLTVPEAEEIARLAKLGDTAGVTAAAVRDLANAEQKRLQQLQSGATAAQQYVASFKGGLHSILSGIEGGLGSLLGDSTPQDQLAGVQTTLNSYMSHRSGPLQLQLLNAEARGTDYTPSIGTGPDQETALSVRQINDLLAKQRALRAEIQKQATQAAQTAKDTAATTKQVNDILGSIKGHTPPTHAHTARASSGKTADDYLASFQDTYAKMVSKGAEALNSEAAAKAKALVGNEAYAQQLASELSLRKNAIDLQVKSVGMGQQEIERMQAKNQVYQDFNRQLASLNRERDRGSISIADYNSRLQDLKAAEGGTLAAMEDGWKRMDAARMDWSNGLKATYADLLVKSKDFATAASQELTDFANGVGDAFVNIVQGGESVKKAFGSVIDTMLADALRFVANQAVTKFLGLFMPNGQQGGQQGGGWESLFGSLLSAYGSNGGFNEGSAESTATSVISALGYAKGGVFAHGDVTKFASGGVVSSPTPFAFGGRLGVMGEAGPEAVVPLQRGRDGKLGVRGGSNTNITVMVQPTTSRRTAEQTATATARELQRAQARA